MSEPKAQADDPTEDETAMFEGWYSRLSCGACGEMLEIEDDVSNGEKVKCDACGATLTVSRFI